MFDFTALDCYGVELDVDAGNTVFIDIHLRSLSEVFLLAIIYPCCGVPVFIAQSMLDFDENQPLSVTADDIDFIVGQMKVAMENFVSKIL